MKGKGEDNSEEAQQKKRTLALQYGVEKLREMKHRMEEERMRELQILNDRLMRDAGRIKLTEESKKQNMTNEGGGP